MAIYENTQTGRRHRTVDGSHHDRRLAASDHHTLIDGPQPSEPALEDLPVDELRDIASDLNVDGYSSMRKAELVDAIRQSQDG